MKYLPLVWSTLWRKKARTLFTLLSIVFAFLLFGMLQGVNAAFAQGVEKSNVNRVIVASRISLTEALPLSQMSQIETVKGVRAVAYTSWFGGYFQDKKNFIFAAPVDIDRYLKAVPEIKVAPDQVEAMHHMRTGILVGQRAAKKYGWKIGDRVPLHSTIWTRKDDGSSDWKFDVVGYFDFPDKPEQTDAVFFNWDYFDEGRAFGKGSVGWWVVNVEDASQLAVVAKAIDKLFENSEDETKSQTEKEFAQSFLKQSGDINLIMTAILLAVFFTLLFLTGNTMMQSVRERTPELAVLKTLGYSDTLVLALVLAESLLLCIVAAGAGLLLAWLIFPSIAEYVGAVGLPSRVLFEGAVTAVVLAGVIGLVPALRAKRLNIVDALATR